MTGAPRRRRTATTGVGPAGRTRIAQRIVKGWPHPMELARLYRVPYRLLIPCIPRPLIHKGRKP